MRTLGKKDLARWREIVRILSRLSRGGWEHADPAEYIPLQNELAALAKKRLSGTKAQRIFTAEEQERGRKVPALKSGVDNA